MNINKMNKTALIAEVVKVRNEFNEFIEESEAALNAYAIESKEHSNQISDCEKRGEKLYKKLIQQNHMIKERDKKISEQALEDKVIRSNLNDCLEWSKMNIFQFIYWKIVSWELN